MLTLCKESDFPRNDDEIIHKSVFSQKGLKAQFFTFNRITVVFF